ncbi:MAG TPA: glycoside hydrolase family 2 TIM barrel-domain containing protein [Anaerolineae bacterium]|nr:glycoside hydrolase family 2 TIM barrel-domain containing protein [Anaerolineae bacterium]
MELKQSSLPVNSPQLQTHPDGDGADPDYNPSFQWPEPETSVLPARRHRLSLDGTWEFQFDPTDCAELNDIATWREAHVPIPWQAEFDDLREQAGTAWYRRRVQVPPEWAGQSVILHFGAGDYYAQVWLNGALVGDHAGGNLPFEFEIGDQINWAETNELVVRVTGPIDDPQRYPEFCFSEIPHGKQSWYGPLNGIWQSVWLESRCPFHIQATRLQTELASGQVQVDLSFSRPTDNADWVLLNIVDPSGALVTSTRASLPAGDQRTMVSVGVTHPLAWSPTEPHLYRLEVGLGHGEAQVDSLVETFGFRTIEAREGRLFLNGDPLYLRGALDQDYYPETIATPPSVEFLEDQLHKAKALGLNCLRCHIKVADPRYYEVADRLGMLVWAELPNWRLLTESSAQRGLKTLEGIIERDGHHPSIIAWTIINENWGTDLVHDPTHRAWLKNTYHWLKALDPTRLVIDNSPCWPNFHVQTDIEDYHYYRAIPDRRRQWDEFVTAFAGRVSWTYSPYGDAVRTGQEPLIVSEFGNWGLPDVDLLLDEGQEPWWFETGQEWDDGVVHPHGVRRRFRAWYLDRVFGSWRAFIEATQWQQYLALKYEIESMRRQPEIVGYVITEFTDVHWEANGLLDIKRNPKVFHDVFAAINADTVIVPEWERVSYWAGEPVRVNLTIAHGAGPDLSGAELRWSLGAEAATGRITVPPLTAGQVRPLEPVTFYAPTVTSPGLHRLSLNLYAANGDHLAANHVDLSLLPQRAAPAKAELLWTPEPELAERLTALGYALAPDYQTARVIVTHRLDDTLAGCIREGSHLLLLADDPEAIGWHLPGVQVKTRENTSWSGDWASSFAWVRRLGPLADLPGGPLIDHSFDRVIPDYVLTGFSPLDFAAHVYGGLMVGWIHKPVALIAARRYGEGRAVLTTFRLTTDIPGLDPVATTLLDSLIKLTLAK